MESLRVDLGGFMCSRGTAYMWSLVGSGLINYLEQEESSSGSSFLK